MKIILNITKTMEKKITICSIAILVVCLWATASFASRSYRDVIVLIPRSQGYM